MSSPADRPLNKGTHSKPKRSFISRLPSFRKKKTPTLESDLDMHIRSAHEDLNSGVKVRPPNQVKNRKEDDVKRRSKTSSIVASYEKRLSDLKDEEIRTNGKRNKASKSATLGQHGSSKASLQDGEVNTSKASRFGFGFAWQKITSFENSSSAKSNGDKLNANVSKEGVIGSSVKTHSLELMLPVPHGSPPDREASSNVRTPDSDRSSVSSNSSAKVYGQPMPYRSVFSDEPRGIKRQASSSQSEGFNSSGISMSRSTSPLHDNKSSVVETHHESVESGSQLSSTLVKDNKVASTKSLVLNSTFPIEESPTCIVNRTFKLEPEEDCSVNGKISEAKATYKQGLVSEPPELSPKEKPISCPTDAPGKSSMDTDSHSVSCLSEDSSKALDKATWSDEQDVSCQSATTANNIPTEINSVYSCIKNSNVDTLNSPRHHQATSTMGGMHSTVESYSTPVRPMDLACQLRKPQISAIKHYSESLDSCELDSLCSEDLMCDSRYLDDEMFDTKEESSLLNRSLSVQESAAMYRSQHYPTNPSASSRNRSISVDQAQLHPTVSSLDKRNKNMNASSSRVPSTSGANSHPLRPPRWPSLPQEEDGAVLVDASIYRHMVQDMTSVKTMLLKLKRSLQEVDSASSPFEHSLLLPSPCNSLPTSPVAEAHPLKEVIIEELKEENTVLRKEVKNLQELLADTQHELKEAHLYMQKQKATPEQQNISTQCCSEMKDQSQQVNLQPSVEQQQEKLSKMTSPNDSSLKVGHSPTSPEPPPSELNSHLEVSPTGRRTAAQHPGSKLSSPERTKGKKTEMSKTVVPSVPAKVSTVANSHAQVPPQKSNVDDAQVMAGSISRSTPVSPSRKGAAAAVTSQSPRIGRPKNQSIRSKLMQPISYKSKAKGPQDKVPLKGTQFEDECQPTGDKKGGLLKQPLASPQVPKGSGAINKAQKDSQSDIQKEPLVDTKGITGEALKQNAIATLPSQHQSGNSVNPSLKEVKDNQLHGGQKDSESSLSRMPKSSIPKAALATKKELQTSLRYDADQLLPLTDANSNPVIQQNGLPTKRSGLQQPQTVRKIEPSESTGARQKAVANNSNQSAQRKPGAQGMCRLGSPDTESSDEERTMPPLPQPTGQDQSKASRIAMPVRGRGMSKLPRGSGIPSRRTNNS